MEDVERGLATEVKHLERDLGPAIAQRGIRRQLLNRLLQLFSIDLWLLHPWIVSVWWRGGLRWSVAVGVVDSRGMACTLADGGGDCCGC